MPESVVAAFAQNRTLTRVAGYALLMGAYAAIPSWFEHTFPESLADLPSDLHAALALVLGWVLVFRTNTSYARWWEARTLWGALVNTSRNMAIKVADLVRADEEYLVRFRRKIIAFAYALKDHLRDDVDLHRLPGFEEDPDSPQHVPSYLVTRMYERLAEWKDSGFIDGDELRVLDEEARRFLDICGGCERIKNTLLSRSYRSFARQCVVLFLATFPWGIVHDFVWWTIPLTALVAYFMIGLETVAEHVEEPFGHDIDDLDLDGLCATIERTVDEIFERRLKRPDTPVVAG